MPYIIQVNGQKVTADVESETPLLWVLRDTLNLKGTKYGCGAAQCGACTIHLGGQATRSCQIPVSVLGASNVTTIEGIGENPIGRKVQQAWLELDVAQCGYCQPGQIMSATALLQKTPNPTDQDINQAMNGNLCRCATYTRIRAAIKRAAELMRA